MKWLAIGLLTALVSTVTLAVGRDSRSPRELVYNYVRGQMGFSGSDWNNLLRGRAVARIIDTDQAQDVAIFGAVRIEARPDRLLANIRRIDQLERRLGVMQIGLFDDPPGIDDLAALTLEPDDLRDLSNCRALDCELQMSERALNLFGTRVDWRAADAAQEANRLFREMLFDRLRTYRAGGMAALEPYADRNPPTPVAPEFERIIVPSDIAFDVPALVNYVRRAPQPLPPGAEDFFYWNKGNFGMKPTTRLNHVTIYHVTNAALQEQGLRFVVATRQIYANHYFSATLEWRTIVADLDGDTDAFFLLYSTRSRVTGLKGFIGGLIRSIVKGRARSGMEKYLGGTKTALEAPAS